MKTFRSIVYNFRSQIWSNNYCYHGNTYWYAKRSENIIWVFI